MTQTAVQLNPYLFFGGNCRQAMQFYQTVFGGELHLSTFGESPENAHADARINDPATKDMIMHASLTGPVIIMASDNPSEPNLQSTNAFSLSLGGDDNALLSGYFQKLSQGGTVTLPLSKQFWGDVFGMVKDKYGINWMVSIKA